jgi:adenosylcobinamide-GDP ribazoletransferase
MSNEKVKGAGMARRRLWPAWLQDLAGAWVFYSVLPGWPGSTPRFVRIARFAPWIGLVLGGLEGLLWLLTAGWLPQPVQVCLVIALGLILSGGLHLDGVIDTADGLAAGSRALEAMDDSRAGAAGVQALALLLLLRAAGLLALAALTPPLLVAWILVLTAIWGRVSPLVAIARFPYLRDGGTAGFHRQGQRGLGRELLPALLLLVALALLAWLLSAPAARATPLPALLLPLLLPALPAVAVPLWLGRRLGGHSGDSYGACVEWSQTVGLLLCALVLSAPALRVGLMAAG